ncbi:DUF5522 domain-containing protein [Aureispira anguillae]|uniref:DUF5522 domain-containing protein n=1 Tax=Aureispira anguillae TaxID=2864201 RepID=A0A916DV08_9BACT|nr:DUF5522 domain-containing protein [Aureispira anguillae]BDS14634.1 DUF5522 domain-containing protein [Aureispira anguillae]
MFSFIKRKEKKPAVPVEKPLVEQEDFYIENGCYVFTALYLKKRGYCCGNGCRHCPYPKGKEGQQEIRKD